MNDLPAPLTPEWLDGRNLGFMPFDADAYIRPNGSFLYSTRHNAARVSLMAWSWIQRPAASLAVRVERMFTLIPETPSWWKKNSADVLSEWTLCSDGKYYHRWLAEQANKRGARVQAKAKHNNLLGVSPSQWRRLRKAVFERDGYRCSYCGERPANPHCDHIIPITRGGKSEMDNLTTACGKCNISKSNSVLSDWLEQSGISK